MSKMTRLEKSLYKKELLALLEISEMSNSDFALYSKIQDYIKELNSQMEVKK